MKHIFTPISIIAVALMALSCSKHYLSPEEVFKLDLSAKVTLVSNSGDSEKKEFSIPTVAVFRKSEIEGQSWFTGFSGGKMVDDSFFISIYFNNVDKLKAGDELKISRFRFSFLYSSDSRASTDIYSGKITVEDKGDDFILLNFHRVLCRCSFGVYLTDGYLYCPLYDEYIIDD